MSIIVEVKLWELEIPKLAKLYDQLFGFFKGELFFF